MANAAAALAGAHDYKTSEATLQQSEANNEKAQNDLARYKQLLAKREVAQSEFDQYNFMARAQAAALEAQRASLQSAAKTVEQRQAQLNEEQAKPEQTVQNAPRQILIRNNNILQREASVQSSAAQVSPGPAEPQLLPHHGSRIRNCDAKNRRDWRPDLGRPANDNGGANDQLLDNGQFQGNSTAQDETWPANYRKGRCSRQNVWGLH